VLCLCCKDGNIPTLPAVLYLLCVTCFGFVGLTCIHVHGPRAKCKERGIVCNLMLRREKLPQC
jgi:hypothetical protein